MLAVGVALTFAMAGCGTESATPPPPDPVASVSATHAKAKPKRAQSTKPPDRDHSASTWPWPLSVSQSLDLVTGHTQPALMGPVSLPRGNSVKVSFSSTQYAVNVFDCPTAEPINSSLIGQGVCGAMASFAEGFGAKLYPTAAAARDALRYQTPPGSPVPMNLPGGLTGRRWRIRGQSGPRSTEEIVWHEGDWTIVVSGGSPERSSAMLVAHLLQQYLLPPYPGLLTVDVAGDGLHTSVEWALGSTVYSTSAMHNPAHAVIMASSMKPFPTKP